jgi:hypothetical protein
METSSFTRKLNSEANEITREVIQLFSRLSETQMNWKSSAGKWSIGQVIDHVNKSNTFYLHEIEKILHAGKLKSDKRSKVRGGMFGVFALRALEPGNNRKRKTHPLFQPSSDILDNSVVDQFVYSQQRLSFYLDILADFDLTSAKVSSPSNRLIRFRIGDFLSLIITHEKRHLLQAKNIFNSVNFPMHEFIEIPLGALSYY